jgi:RNA polymerase sigma-70 factor (ECF subfamily)
MRDSDTTTAWDALRVGLHHFIRKRVRDEAIAEDLVHDVLLKAYTAKETLQHAGKLRPWLYQIARNAIIDHYRAKKPSVPLPDEFSEETSTDPRTAEREMARCLQPLIERLPSDYRIAISLAEIDGLTQAEVASRLGLSLSGAKSRVQRARRLLAEALQDCCRLELDRRGGIADYRCQRGCVIC